MDKFETLIIYYFSGTGNAKRAAEWIIEVAKQNGLNTELIKIDHYKFEQKPEFNQKTLVGFCGPTHGFNFPPIMMHFIFRFPGLGKASVFILNTRGGLKMSKLFLPGLSGLTQYMAAIVLAIKGYKIVGMQPLDMPSNWISLHPGLKPKIIDSIIKRCQEIVKRFANKTLQGKRSYKAFISLPFDLAVVPISLAYYLVGRFAIAKTFVATDACTNCGLCEKSCPVGAIKNSKIRPYWTFECESCMHCMNYCPERAIETALGFTAILWWFVFSLIPLWGLKMVFDNSFLNISYNQTFATLIYYFLFSVGALFIIFLSYRLLYFLMRFKFFNKIISYTSLTRYSFWRRYKIPKI